MNTLLAFSGFTIAFVIALYYKRKIRITKQRNKVRFYVARDKDGSLFLYLGKPVRLQQWFVSSRYGKVINSREYLSRYGLNPYYFKLLKWEDEPVEVFIKMED